VKYPCGATSKPVPSAVYDPRIVAVLIELLGEDAGRWTGLPSAASEAFAAAP
jgi:hypothetical protein